MAKSNTEIKESKRMTGAEIKQLIQGAGLKLWQVAQLWGCSDGNFSRRLRKPFSAEDVERIKAIIAELTENREDKK